MFKEISRYCINTYEVEFLLILFGVFIEPVILFTFVSDLLYTIRFIGGGMGRIGKEQVLY